MGNLHGALLTVRFKVNQALEGPGDDGEQRL
jgi:hypothetical protein